MCVCVGLPNMYVCDVCVPGDCVFTADYIHYCATAITVNYFLQQWILGLAALPHR